MQTDNQDNSPQPSQAQDSQPEGQEEAQSQAPPESSQEDSQEASQEEGQEASPDAEGEEAEATEEAAEEKPPKPDEKHKRTGGYQRKIDRLEREKQMLLEALHAQRGTPPTPPGPAKEKTPAEQAEEYVNNLVEQRLRAAEAQRREAKIRADFQKRTDEARARFEDFDSAIEDVAHIKVSDWVRDALLTSEKPGEIMYQLAKNPAELARLSALPPLDAAREIGRLEAKLASGASPVKPKPAARPPAPPSKVGGSAASTRSLEDLPLSEYKRLYRSGRR